MATLQECVEVSLELLHKAGIAPNAWPALRPALRRAAVARALGTQQSDVIDMALAMLEQCMPSLRTTGEMTPTAAGAGAMVTLAVLGGALLGAAGLTWLQRVNVDTLDPREYEAKVWYADRDWHRDGTRYATINEIETGFSEPRGGKDT